MNRKELESLYDFEENNSTIVKTGDYISEYNPYQDYECPVCHKVTKKLSDKMQCNCFREIID